MIDFFQTKISEYLNYLVKIRHYSPLTIKTYEGVLKEALKYIEFTQIESGYEINLLPYRHTIHGLHKKSIYKKITIVRSFVTYLKKNGVEVKLIGDERIKLPKNLPKPVNEQIIQEALASCNEDERLILYLFYGLGVRIGELVGLKLEAITKNWVSVKGKGGKIRQIPILDELHILLDSYIKRNGLKIYLFEKDGKMMQAHQIRYRIDKIFKRIGVKATPHQLRHSFASSLLNQGARINDVSELLGHSSLSTTQIYTKLNATTKMRNYQDAHPMCRSEDEPV